MSQMSNIEEVDNEFLDGEESGNENVNNETLAFQRPEDDNITELVVLDPDHPLMKRFQDSLNDMLIKQLERIQLEDRETSEDLRKHRTEHIEAGNELFTVQQELAKFQTILEGLNEEYNTARFTRENTEALLSGSKEEYKKVQYEVDFETAKMREMRQEMDNIALRLYYLKSAEEDIKGDIAVMKRAAEKAVEDLHRAEKEKMHQDFILDTLVNEVARLKEDIGLYEAQLVAQEDEKCAAKLTLHEAENEIQSIILERKQLMNKWNSCLIDLTRRNEAFCAINEALSEKKEQILVLQNEIEGYKRNTRKEQDLNERMTLICKKSEYDISNLKKSIEDHKAKYAAMKSNYTNSINILHQTETVLAQIIRDKKEQLAITEEYQKSIESLYKLKNELEDKMDEELRKKITMKSLAQCLDKEIKRTRDQSRQLESQVVLLANVESNNALKLAELKSEISEIDRYLKIMEEEINEKNDTINKLEVEMGRSKTFIERRQDTIDRLNKQLELLLQSRGGIEVGPLEITINHLNKNIQTVYEEISDLEQQWLRKQHEIVKLFNEKEALNEDISRLKQQSFLLVQKKIRLESYITKENGNKRVIEKELLQIQNKMVKINNEIFRETFSRENLEKINNLAETDFVRELKEEEMETIKLQSKIDEIESKKDQYLKDIVENQWQAMMYEKKIQLIQEAQLTISSDLGQGEIKAMKTEIHRMEIRFKQLALQQEYLIQDMEKSVVKRDIITKRGEALEKIQNKVTTKGALEKTIAQIKRKTVQIKKNALDCEEKTVIYRNQLKLLVDKVKEQEEINSVQNREITNLIIHLDEISILKYSQLMELQYKQQMFKYYSEVKNKKYVRICKTSTALGREKKTQSEKMNSLILIIDRIISEYPQTQSSLNPTRQLVQKYLEEN